MTPIPIKKKDGRGGKRVPKEGKKIGRPKVERAPDVADKQFAGRVLGYIGKAKYKKFYYARLAWEAFPALHSDWALAQAKFEGYPKMLKVWETEGGKPKDKPKPLVVPGPEPIRPPHPKEIVECDEDLAMYYLTCGDLGLEHRTWWGLTEKRDGKAQHTVNHLHDKPLEHNITLNLGERMKLAMERADARLLAFKRK